MGQVRCAENERLLHDFSDAVRELVLFTEQHFTALVSGEQDAERFEVLMHLAGEKRQAAKYAYLNHIEEHGCENIAHAAIADLAEARELNGSERRDRRSNLIRRRTRVVDFTIV